MHLPRIFNIGNSFQKSTHSIFNVIKLALSVSFWKNLFNIIARIAGVAFANLHRRQNRFLMNDKCGLYSTSLSPSCLSRIYSVGGVVNPPNLLAAFPWHVQRCSPFSRQLVWQSLNNRARKVAVFYKDSEQSLMLDFIGRMCGRWYGIGRAGNRARFLETGMESFFFFLDLGISECRSCLIDKMNFVTPVRRGMACHAPANRSTRRAL